MFVDGGVAHQSPATIAPTRITTPKAANRPADTIEMVRGLSRLARRAPTTAPSRPAVVTPAVAPTQVATT